MIPMTLRQIADVLRIDAPTEAGDVTVTSVEFDSRKVHPGALFVALPGDHVDGADFAGDAAAAGAVAVLAQRSVSELPTLVCPLVGSDDAASPQPVLRALAVLASHVARELVSRGLTIIGVTGSAGKTSTKDLIAQVLADAGSVVAPTGSFNNELGHPYTVLRAESTTDYLVLELSARGVGHIAALAKIAPPQIGAVLNVGSAHIGEFGSRQAIAQAKGELVEALPSAADGGVAIVNADDPLVIAMAGRTDARIVRTSLTAPDAEVRADDLILDSAARAGFTITIRGERAPVQLQVVGQHQVANALAAAAVADAVGMGLVSIARGLSRATALSRWRMEVTQLPGGITVINDAYNANPESVQAALDALASMAGPRRQWAVLGEMAELGDSASSAHVAVGRRAQQQGAQVVAVGAGGYRIFDGANEVFDAQRGYRPIWNNTVDGAVSVLSRLLEPGDVVLVKASRSAGLEQVVAELTAREEDK